MCRTRRDAWTQPPSRRSSMSSIPSSPRRNSPESLVYIFKTKELSQKTQIEFKFGWIRCDEKGFWRKTGLYCLLIKICRKITNFKYFLHYWMCCKFVSRGWDLAEWLERLTANAKVATVLGSIPASTETMESEGRLWKKCFKNPKIPLKISLLIILQ